MPVVISLCQDVLARMLTVRPPQGKSHLTVKDKRHRGYRCRLAVVILLEVKNLAYHSPTYAPIVVFPSREFPFWSCVKKDVSTF